MLPVLTCVQPQTRSLSYVEGNLEGAELEAFEAALVASPEFRAEVDTTRDRLSMLDAEIALPVKLFWLVSNKV